MWKDFFFYSKKDKIAIGILSTIIVLSLLLLNILPNKHEIKTSLSLSDSITINQPAAKKTKKNKPSHKRDNTEHVNYSLFRFDPNTIDSIHLIQLGVSPFVTQNILRYRAKKGVFRTPESFSRIYGLTEETYNRLLPYIYIGHEYQRQAATRNVTQTNKPFFQETNRVSKYSEGTQIDLNKADTTELQKIPGIGSVLSKKIVLRRKRLGGFYDVSQLQEISPYLSADINRWFVIEELPTPNIFINKDGIDSLRKHPYLNYRQARIIVEHRQKRGPLKQLQELSLYKEFTTKDLERIQHYVSFQ